MADKSHNQTDKLLEQMEKRISAIYAEAQVEMKKKAETYFDAFIAEGDRKLKLVKAGKLEVIGKQNTRAYQPMPGALGW